MIKNKTAVKSTKTILLLGGFGFVGTNIIKEIIKSKLNYNLIVLSDKSSEYVDEIKSGIKTYVGDFSNNKLLDKIFRNNQIDIVLHLISSTVPGNSNDDIVSDINNNLINSVRLLELMKIYSVKKIIYFSSGGAIYGNQKHKSLKENSYINPISSYGIVKYTMEKYIKLYNYLYGIDYLILRVSNVYGEYHQSNIQGLINVCFKKVINNEPIIVWGSGDMVRDYIYIGDVVKITLYMIENEIKNEIINIGTGKGYSINQIISIIKIIFGKKVIVEYRNTRKYDINKVVLNNSKLLSLNKFDFTEIENGMRRTFKWIKCTK